ncbi:Uncharacterised protein [Serratia proteamaculans]|nr:hypothetical protein BSQ97_06810 [Serratia proteamaculans]RYM55897.1 hypothetical protein BSQ96_04135 [Serratia proteamaculans]CAI0775489.1 Uncharacterised protein [Serratia proteamaculans]CAI0795753.1 Uncharacterised protein [Serratia proteamaculans]CAI0796659.1 Uncharacterised protein [Serratia proteamaculans]
MTKTSSGEEIAAPDSSLSAARGDPNFMASPARGLEVIQAFTPQLPILLEGAEELSLLTH